MREKLHMSAIVGGDGDSVCILLSGSRAYVIRCHIEAEVDNLHTMRMLQQGTV